MNALSFIWHIVLFVGGYVKIFINGLENEARAFRAKAMDLEAKIRGL